jgi:hypothetical protein
MLFSSAAIKAALKGCAANKYWKRALRSKRFSSIHYIFRATSPRTLVFPISRALLQPII